MTLRKAIPAIVYLAALAEPSVGQQIITGTVSDAATGDAVNAVSIVIGERVVATSDGEGTFRLESVVVPDSGVAITFRRIGYTPRVFTWRVSNGLPLDVVLEPWPETLETIVVEGEQLRIRNPGLIGFYRRRADDFGRYLTEPEIQRSKGFELTQYMRRLFALEPRCTRFGPVVYYLDGIQTTFQVINGVIPPNQLAGIEVYLDERVTRLPPEFTPAGPYCGVIMFWTREPKPASSIVFGVHYAGSSPDGGARGTYVGGQIRLPLRSDGSTLALQAAGDASLDDGGEPWYAWLNVIIQPLGAGSPWYLGTGLVLAKPDPGLRRLEDPGIEARHGMVTGISWPRGPLRPFAELRTVNLHRPSTARLFVALGLNVRLGPS